MKPVGQLVIWFTFFSAVFTPQSASASRHLVTASGVTLRVEFHDLHGLSGRTGYRRLTVRSGWSWSVWILLYFASSASHSSGVSRSSAAASGAAALGFVGDFSHTLALEDIPRAGSFGLGARDRGLQRPPNITYCDVGLRITRCDASLRTRLRPPR